eukprot:INCI10276.2.p1 GENE.INCI10276.2~~INCI10276.2.p1  ORF type:complete len:283 (-),score=21.26 INCI10276.2:211-1059(-)
MASGNARMLQDSEDAPPPCKRSRVPKQHGPKREPQSASEGAFLSRGVEDEQGEAGMLPCGGDGLRHRETSNEGEPARSLLPTEGAVQRENSALASSRVVDTADRTTVRPNGHTGQEARPLERDGFRIETICIDSNCDCVAEKHRHCTVDLQVLLKAFIFKCPVCACSMDRESNLEKHMKKHKEFNWTPIPSKIDEIKEAIIHFDGVIVFDCPRPNSPACRPQVIVLCATFVHEFCTRSGFVHDIVVARICHVYWLQRLRGGRVNTEWKTKTTAVVQNIAKLS